MEPVAVAPLIVGLGLRVWNRASKPEPEKYNSYTTTDGHYYVGDLWSVDPTEELTLEDGSRLALEDATDLEKHERFVTERSFNLGSYFMKSEVQDTMVYEDGSRIIQENAISFGEPVERLGPTLGDLAKIGFSQSSERSFFYLALVFCSAQSPPWVLLERCFLTGRQPIISN